MSLNNREFLTWKARGRVRERERERERVVGGRAGRQTHKRLGLVWER
jgi:hypothetical protein